MKIQTTLEQPHWDWLQPYLTSRLRQVQGVWQREEWLEELEEIAERCDSEPWSNGIGAEDFDAILAWLGV